jgi:hypothetical protein
MNIHKELKAISVGNNFFIETQISKDEVNKLIKNNHHICFSNSSPGKIIIALENQAANSTLLYVGDQYDELNHIDIQILILFNPI